MLVGYARVSIDNQDYALQIDALKQAGFKRIFRDEASGIKIIGRRCKKPWTMQGEGDTPGPYDDRTASAAH